MGELRKKYPKLVSGKFDLASEEEILKFEEFAKGQSLFSEKKLAITENAFEAEEKKAAALFKELAGRKDLAVIISEKDKPVKALDFLAKLTTAEKFENLEGAEWAAYARRLAKDEDVVLSPGAAKLLFGLYQGNSWGLVTELKKLSALGEKTIEEKDVEGLGLERAVEYWPLLNSLKSPNLETRLWALKKLSDQNEQAAKTFNIWAASNKQKAATFAALDVLIKSGKLDYEEALLALAIA